MQTRTYRVEVKYRRTMMAAINNITFSVMIFPTFDLHAVRSRLYKSCPEMDGGREFRVEISPRNKVAQTRRGHVYLDHVYLRTSFGSGGLRLP